MTKKLMISTAIGALLMSGALAQSPNSPANSSPPAAKPTITTPAQPSSGKADFVMSQKSDQWLASKFNGTDVMSSDNKKIGLIRDILFDKTGKVEAYVVSVGGFLGMGAKEVALAPSSFEVIPGHNGKADVLKLSLNEDELKQAQSFARYEPPRPTTTGSGSAGLSPLPGAGARPSSNKPPTVH
jgi:sporulation protein YlmC with PRC-barrel domain